MSSHSEPLVSIITPVFNGAEFLEDLIVSVMRQDYPRIEHIVIDDGSDDGGATVGVLKNFDHLRWWQRENRGQLNTVNEGIRESRGEILSLISADDRYIFPSSFATAVEALRVHRDAGFVYGEIRNIGPDGALLPFETFVEPRGPFSTWLLRHRSCIYHCSLFVRRSAVIRNGLWLDPSFKYLGDWDWISRMLECGVSGHFVPEPLAEYRMHGAQTTARTQEKTWRIEAARICRRNRVSFFISMLVRRYFYLRHRALRFYWLYRTGGTRLLSRRAADKIRQLR